MNQKLLQFHYEEIVYALIILAAELNHTDKEELKNFAEALIRYDELTSEAAFLTSLKTVNPNIGTEAVSKLQEFSQVIPPFIGPQGYAALALDTEMRQESRERAIQLLIDLGEEIIAPLDYADQKMDVNW